MQKQYKNNFGLVKVLAAFLVFAGHMYVLIGDTVIPSEIIFQEIHRFGVITLFVISGYLIAKSWERDRNYLNFIIKRVFRIIPGLFVYCLIAACIVGPIATNLSLREYFSDSLFYGYFRNVICYAVYPLPGVFASNPYPWAVNGALWTLPVEFMMYLFVPIICEAGKLIKGKFIVAIAGIVCISSIVWQLCFSETRIVFYSMEIGTVLSIVPFYLLGVMISQLKINEKYYNLTISCVILIICSALRIHSIVIKNILSFLIIPYIIFSMVYGSRNKVGEWFNKWDISYGIFLYGFMVQQFVVYIFISKMLGSKGQFKE